MSEGTMDICSDDIAPVNETAMSSSAGEPIRPNERARDATN